MLKRLLTTGILYIWTVSVLLAAEISAIRVSGESHKARVVLDLDDNIQYKTFRLTNPDRIVIDINNARLLPNPQRQSSDNEFINRIRIGRHDRDVLRIVLDLKQAVEYVHFTLPPDAGKSHRLVIDLQTQLPSRSGNDTTPLTVMIDQQQYQQAYDWARSRHDNWQGDKEFYFMLGLAANETGNADHAIKPLQQYVILQPDHLWARLELARAFYLAGKHELSQQEFQLVLSSNPPARVKNNIQRFLQRIAEIKTPASPTFYVAGFKIHGNTLLDEKILSSLLSPFAGESRDFGDIQKALDTLQAEYRSAGYGAVYLYLPEQELIEQIVQINVIEPRIASVTVQGNKYHDSINIRQSLPTLDEKTIPNTLAIEENVKHANENASKNIRIQFLAAEEQGKLNAIVSVEDKKTSNWFVSLDNSGTSTTGESRLSLGYQHHNIFNQDHLLNLNYTTSADEPDKVSIYGIGYHIPRYQNNADLDFYAGTSDVDSGVVGNIFTVSGKGSVLGTRYKQRLRNNKGFAHSLTYGLDYRAYDNNVTLITGGSSIVPDVTVRPASLGYDATWQGRKRQLSVNTQYFRNLPGGNNGDDAAFAASRNNATADYQLIRFNLDYLQVLNSDWQLHAAIQSQFTSDALVPGEQFGIGGAQSVRGFDEREVSNDKGYLVNLEIYSPEFCAGGTGVGQFKCRALGFVDAGSVSRNKPLSGETASDSIASIGGGLRLTMGDNLSFSTDLAYILDSGTLNRDGDSKIHAKLTYVF